MKKLITILLSVIMIITTSTIVYAESIPYYQATQMTYEVPSSFTALIPMSINAGESVSVSVKDVNLADDKQIATSICYLDENDEIKLTKCNESGYASVKVYDNNNMQYTRGNTLIGLFTTDNQEYIVHTEVQCPEGLKAGTYTGNMSFKFEIIDV